MEDLYSSLFEGKEDSPSICDRLVHISKGRSGHMSNSNHVLAGGKGASLCSFPLLYIYINYIN